MELLAKTFAGLEMVLAEELKNLGAENIQPQQRAVAFEGDLKLLYRANYELHTAVRILKPIVAFRAPHKESFYKQVRQIEWERYLHVDSTLAVDAVSFSKHFSHSKYLALLTKDAIVDHFREATGRRPNVDLDNPTLRIHVYVNKDHCSITLDSSGASLHKRGYRAASVPAPLNEVLAAGLIGLSNWSKEEPFIDPMCGSGTLLIEAALWANRIPPQWKRKRFGFMGWFDFDKDLWEMVKQEAEAMVINNPIPIFGYDKSFKAIKATQENILSAHLEGKVKVERCKFQKLEKPVESGCIIMNPPYDERLLEADINALYKSIGDHLKQSFTNFTAWVISSNKDALKHFGLRPSKKYTLYNGSLPCKYQRFDLYQGSKKSKKMQQPV